MSRIEKLINRLEQKPKDFTYEEAKRLLESLGCHEDNKGKTSGSRIVFKNDELNDKIELHKLHPSNILKIYQINIIIKKLEEWRIL